MLVRIEAFLKIVDRSLFFSFAKEKEKPKHNPTNKQAKNPLKQQEKQQI